MKLSQAILHEELIIFEKEFSVKSLAAQNENLFIGTQNGGLLKFENKNEKEVTVSWKEAFETAQVPEKRTPNETFKKITLAPGVTSQENCETIVKKECMIIPDEIASSYHATVTEYYFESVSVSNK